MRQFQQFRPLLSLEETMQKLNTNPDSIKMEESFTLPLFSLKPLVQVAEAEKPSKSNKVMVQFSEPFEKSVMVNTDPDDPSKPDIYDILDELGAEYLSKDVAEKAKLDWEERKPLHGRKVLGFLDGKLPDGKEFSLTYPLDNYNETASMDCDVEDDRPDEDYDPKELAMGIKIEKEHTSDEKVAAKICRDHLDEFPDYYTRLEKLEKKAKQDKAGDE
jgi:hypothetical protein